MAFHKCAGMIFPIFVSLVVFLHLISLCTCDEFKDVKLEKIKEVAENPGDSEFISTDEPIEIMEDEEEEDEEEDIDFENQVILRPDDWRESFALMSAIQLYNVTQDFAEKMKLAFKYDHYKDILKKEGVALKKEMNSLEKQYITVLKQIEASGGIQPKKDNDTSQFEQFAIKMAGKYEAMVKNTKSFTERLLGALVEVKKDKAKILEELKKFTTYKTKYENTRGFLEAQGIFLRHPNPPSGAPPVEKIDVAILQSLMKYYKQIDDFDDNVLPILEKYGSIDKMDKLTSDYLIVEEAIQKVRKVDVMVKYVAKQNDNMLRHFETITNLRIAKAQEAIPEMAQTYEGLQSRIMEVTKDLSAQDVRIRGLHKKLNVGCVMLYQIQLWSMCAFQENVYYNNLCAALTLRQLCFYSFVCRAFIHELHELH